MKSRVYSNSKSRCSLSSSVQAPKQVHKQVCKWHSRTCNKDNYGLNETHNTGLLICASVGVVGESDGMQQVESSSIFATMPQVVLKGGKAKLFSGDYKSPIVYGGAIDCVIGKPTPHIGDLVLVQNGKRETIGFGFYNPCSMYRVRMLQTVDEMPEANALKLGDKATLDDYVKHIILSRIKSARELRSILIGKSADVEDNSLTTYRMINSEGDRLSGLVVDVISNIAVVHSSAAWVEQWRDDIEQYILQAAADVDKIVWRRAENMLKMEGIEFEESDENHDADELSVAHEFGAKFFVSPFGQKTGFYADQRDNRQFIRSISKGKSVLDICCYSGGFSIHAALGGATSVIGVDSSSSAIDLAKKNSLLNNVESCAEFCREDATKFMQEALKQGKQWDIVILDPPKLAPSKGLLKKAMRKYVALNAAAMKLVNPGGILMTCSCSGAMNSSGEFTRVIQMASQRAQVSATIILKRGAGLDHCLDPGYPEGEYLTNFTLRINER
eukprot:jgi/Picsp_1/2919/NSC_01144-R1_ribosomal rna large subunit methyltransferase i-like